MGIASSQHRIVPLDELESIYPRYLTHLRESSETAENWSADERGAVQRRLDRVREAVGPLSVVWLALVDSEPVGVEVAADAVLRGALNYLVSRAGDLMLATPDLAGGGICIELNHLAAGDEYEVVAWGVFADESSATR